jgi:hypothetical protein
LLNLRTNVSLVALLVDFGGPLLHPPTSAGRLAAKLDLRQGGEQSLFQPGQFFDGFLQRAGALGPLLPLVKKTPHLVHQSRAVGRRPGPQPRQSLQQKGHFVVAF